MGIHRLQREVLQMAPTFFHARVALLCSTLIVPCVGQSYSHASQGDCNSMVTDWRNLCNAMEPSCSGDLDKLWCGEYDLFSKLDDPNPQNPDGNTMIHLDVAGITWSNVHATNAVTNEAHVLAGGTTAGTYTVTLSSQQGVSTTTTNSVTAGLSSSLSATVAVEAEAVKASTTASVTMSF